MASNDKKAAKKTPSKEVAKAGDDVFNVVGLVEKSNPPKVEISKKTKDEK